MHRLKINNNLIIPENFKYVEVNNVPTNLSGNEHFIKGLRNAHNMLNCLEQSFEKSSKYEDKLLRCKSTHNYLHDSKDWSSSNISPTEVSELSNKDKSRSSKTRTSVDITESWSTMSIVCLQYQDVMIAQRRDRATLSNTREHEFNPGRYEELSKRYQALLRAYDQRCNSLNCQGGDVLQLRKRIKEAHDELARLNKSLLIIGDKYLHLKFKRLTQKVWYEERIERLKRVSRSVFMTAERARLDLDEKLQRSMACEHDIAIALLLDKIKKCNLLFLENLRLKSRVEEMI